MPTRVISSDKNSNIFHSLWENAVFPVQFLQYAFKS